MIKFSLMIALLTSLSAHASYFATHCSDAMSSVRWETGHNSNSLYVKYHDEAGAQQLAIKLSDVKIELNEKNTILFQESAACPNPLASRTEVYSAKATITPSENTPDVFEGKVYKDKIETYVICKFHINSRRFCP